MLTSVKYNMLLVKRMKDILKKLQRVDGPARVMATKGLMKQITDSTIVKKKECMWMKPQSWMSTTAILLWKSAQMTAMITIP